MTTSSRSLALVLSVAVAFAGGFFLGPRLLKTRKGPASAPAQGTLWACGMHPKVIREEPGTCPQCGMALTPISHSASTSGAKSGERKIAYWWDPMLGAASITDRPGKSAMGMDLVPRYEDEIAAGPGVEIDPVVVQNMGVRLARAEVGPLDMTVRTFGSLRAAEPLQEDVTLRLGGFVEKIHADTVGMEIRAGDPLLELYSPDLLVAQEELLASRRALDRLAAGGGDAARAEAGDLLEAARRKLLLWDLDEGEIRRIESLPRGDGRATFRSRAGGVLVEKEIVRGSAVMAGTRVLRIADYSTLWLDAQAYEVQIPHLRIGQRARARLDAFPGESFEGEVLFLSPSLDEKTRTATVRLAFANPDRRLRPGMVARVELRSLVAERAIRIPREAVLDTGARQVAFVSRGAGKFDPRTVRVGASADEGMVEVLDGIAPGEEVVVSGQFLLDAESRLREAQRKFLDAKRGAKGHEHGSPPSVPASAPAQVAGPPPSSAPVPPAPGAPAGETRRRVDALLVPYLKLVDLLAADRYESDLVEAIRAAADGLASDPSPEVASLGKRLHEQARALASAAGDGRRKEFAALSESLVRLVSLVAPSKAVGSTLFVLHCPMFPGSWLQPSREVTNPLYGTEMLHCGEVVRAIVPVEDAAPPASAPHAGHEPR
ncbi:MAG: efflux RND transporter periplasmic adaptor subunit [Planctomycetes bacterium]|nr:efflux RND transporter periplasmic adaptor subunit [Planctomycetota bacterium]